MKDFELTPKTYCNFIDLLTHELEDKPLLIVTTQDPNIGKWGMARLWRAWMKTTGDYMAANGCVMPLMISADGLKYGNRPFNENDAHELFTMQHLGVDKDGTRLSWSKKGREGMRSANREERFVAMMKHNSWCLEKGISLMIPKDSEYFEMNEEYNG